jgi:hypothetical protein
MEIVFYCNTIYIEKSMRSIIIRINKYFATIIHKGKIDPRKETFKGNKCLQQGHA